MMQDSVRSQRCLTQLSNSVPLAPGGGHVMPARIPNAGLSRRDLLKRTGGLAALAALTAACGGNTGRPSSSGGGDGGAKVNLSQWYHQYGETGTQQAAQRYAKAYPDANVAVQWTPGDYDAKLASGLL